MNYEEKTKWKTMTGDSQEVDIKTLLTRQLESNALFLSSLTCAFMCLKLRKDCCHDLLALQNVFRQLKQLFYIISLCELHRWPKLLNMFIGLWIKSWVHQLHFYKEVESHHSSFYLCLWPGYCVAISLWTSFSRRNGQTDTVAVVERLDYKRSMKMKIALY